MRSITCVASPHPGAEIGLNTYVLGLVGIAAAPGLDGLVAAGEGAPIIRIVILVVLKAAVVPKAGVGVAQQLGPKVGLHGNVRRPDARLGGREARRRRTAALHFDDITLGEATGEAAAARRPRGGVAHNVRWVGLDADGPAGVGPGSERLTDGGEVELRRLGPVLGDVVF